MDWLDLLAVQGTLKSLLQYQSSKASILWCSAFLIVQLSHPYMTTGKTIALTRLTFVGKVMSLLFNMLSRLVIIFLPRSDHLLFFFHYLKLIYFNWIITLQYCGAFCHTSTWISHGCTCVPPSPMLTPPPHPIPLGWPRAPALSALLHALSLHWSSVLHMVIYMFHCCSPKSSHSFSHRVQKSVFTYCVSVAALHIGLSLLSF